MLKVILFKTLYGWMAAFNSSHFSNLPYFLDCVLFLLLPNWVSLLYTRVFGLYLYALSNKIELLVFFFFLISNKIELLIKKT